MNQFLAVFVGPMGATVLMPREVRMYKNHNHTGHFPLLIKELSVKCLLGAEVDPEI